MRPVTQRCQVCGRRFALSNLLPAGLVRPAVVDELRKHLNDWDTEGFICHHDLDDFRTRYIESMLESEKGALSDLELEVVESLKEHEIIAADVESMFEGKATFGEALADRIARFGGSWSFILCFAAVLFIWVAVNTIVLLARPFDPYPFILLNLMLSALAALQAPVIMMSQNRQEARDRLRSEHDYRVTLKAELEVRQLHDKLDHLLRQQWERMIEIQRIQVELMTEMRRKRKPSKSNDKPEPTDKAEEPGVPAGPTEHSLQPEDPSSSA